MHWRDYCMVQIMKRALKAAHANGAMLEQALAAFFFSYRTTPHAVTGVTPDSLFIGRKLRTRLQLLTPDIAARVRSKQLQQKEHHDHHCKERKFSLNRSVCAKNFHSGPSWLQAVVTHQVGPVTYIVKLKNGELWRRHINHFHAGSNIPANEHPTKILMRTSHLKLFPHLHHSHNILLEQAPRLPNLQS